MNLEIKRLDPAEYKGYGFTVRYVTDRIYDVELLDGGFRLVLNECDPVEKGFSDELFADWLEAPVAYGAFRNGELIGFVEGSRESWHDVFRISNVFVAEGERGRGIGTRLMGRLIEACREGGFHALVACITGGNEPSIALHRRLGFRQVSCFPQVGRKFGRWLSVVDLQLML